jgi:hypothetical protein
MVEDGDEEGGGGEPTHLSDRSIVFIERNWSGSS